MWQRVCGVPWIDFDDRVHPSVSVAQGTISHMVFGAEVWHADLYDKP
jgi:hypothetical protein